MHSRGNDGPGRVTRYGLALMVVLSLALSGCDDGLISPDGGVMAPAAQPASLTATRGDARAVSEASDAPAVNGAGAPEKIPGQYVVVFEDGVRDVRGLARQLMAEADGEELFTYTHAVRGFAARMSETKAKGLSRNPHIRSITQDAIVYASATQSGATWGLDRIDQRKLPLSGSYSYNTSGQGVTAYIIDSGIRYSHSEFGGRASLGVDFIGTDGADCNGHGTHVAGTVGGSTYGVAKGVRLVSVRVFGCTGGTPWSTVVAAMDWVGANAKKPAVVNMSLGGGRYDPINWAVDALTRQGVTVVVAAGNEGTDACGSSPASAASAITVGATKSDDFRAAFSNYGPCVDIFAPGTAITSAWFSSNTATAPLQGTSMASPHVAGIAALVLAEKASRAPAQVDSVIRARSTKGAVGDAKSANFHLAHSLPSDDLSEPTPPPVPAAPSNLTASVLSISGDYASVRFTWRDNSDNETAFEIFGTSDIALVWIRPGANGTSATASIRVTTWTLSIRAQGSGGWSNPSDPITLAIGATEPSPPPPPPPSPPPDEVTGPVVSISVDCPANKNRCSFDAVTSAPASSIVTYNWNFGDGTSESSSTAFVTAHTYKAKGNYKVVLTVTDADGKTGTAEKLISVKSLAK